MLTIDIPLTTDGEICEQSKYIWKVPLYTDLEAPPPSAVPTYENRLDAAPVPEWMTADDLKERNRGLAVHNVICTMKLSATINILRIALREQHRLASVYPIDTFPAIEIRVFRPQTSVLLFAKGKMVIVGAQSRAAAQNVAYQIIDILRRIGYDIHPDQLKVRSIVCSANAGLQRSVSRHAWSQSRSVFYWESSRSQGKN